MVAFRPENRRTISSGGRSKRQKSLKISSILLASFMILFSTVVLFFTHMMRPESSETSNNIISPQNLSQNQRVNDHGIHQHVEEPDRISLSNEQLFLQTIKDCTDEAKCGHHIPNGSKVQRIAIHSPPSAATGAFFDMIEGALLTYYNNDKQAMSQKIELIRSTHVPPYGYGKSHGYTKIIRVMYTPILKEVFETLSALAIENGPEFFEEMWDKSLIEQSLRQIVRYHCRMSHVAAHTAMLNIDLDSSSIDQDVLNIVKHIIEHIDGEQNEKIFDHKLREIENDIKSKLITNEPFSTTPDLSHRFYYTDEVDTLSEVLQTELDLTNNLQKWPCLSFWDPFSPGDVQNGVSINDHAKTLAKALSPNCSDAFSKCTVKKDRCEEKGDSSCV
mmetsp:Transcript_24994/g.30741  ORF Transcript_24994/g.30741 Transcript_24994/m.30741 type:complete len:389 (+) Transcript_24994:391-1557(+)